MTHIKPNPTMVKLQFGCETMLCITLLICYNNHSILVMFTWCMFMCACRWVHWYVCMWEYAHTFKSTCMACGCRGVYTGRHVCIWVVHVSFKWFKNFQSENKHMLGGIQTLSPQYGKCKLMWVWEMFICYLKNWSCYSNI